MTAPSPRWASTCTGCGRGAEIESRATHGMRALCDQCAAKPYAMPPLAAGDGRASDVADSGDAAAQLTSLLGLTDVGVRILGAELFGSGSRAALEIQLSNGETLTFDSLREAATPGILAAELVACCGALPKVTKPIALKAVALVRSIARQHRTLSDNDTAIDWGTTYLQAADVIDFDLSDQADRWGAFSQLAAIEPSRDPVGVPPPNTVLRHVDGTRLVRSSWFVAHVKRLDSASTREIPTRMCRVGWHRRGTEGRIRASRPGLDGQLNWAFFLVPDGWENQLGRYGVTTSEGLIARTQSVPASRVEAVTDRNAVIALRASA